MKKIILILAIFSFSVLQGQDIKSLKKERKSIKKEIKYLKNLLFISSSELRVTNDPFSEARIVSIVNKEMFKDIIRVEPKIFIYPNDSIIVKLSIIFSSNGINAPTELIKIGPSNILNWENFSYSYSQHEIRVNSHLGYGISVGNNSQIYRNLYMGDCPYEIIEKMANSGKIIIYINDFFNHNVLDDNDHSRIIAMHNFMEIPGKLNLLNNRISQIEEKLK
jgi:hypothetical protein